MDKEIYAAIYELDGDKKCGLYEKYHVKRNGDMCGKHDNCEFFVLDLTHDKFSVAALFAYADHCEAEFPYLAADLRKKAVTMQEEKPWMK